MTEVASKAGAPRSLSLSIAIDQAILNQVRLQEARRELYNFLKGIPDQGLETAGDCPEFTQLSLCLRKALSESERAIDRLNEELDNTPDTALE